MNVVLTHQAACYLELQKRHLGEFVLPPPASFRGKILTTFETCLLMDRVHAKALSSQIQPIHVAQYTWHHPAQLYPDRNAYNNQSNITGQI